MRLISWAATRLIEVWVEKEETWPAKLLEEFQSNREKVEKSHKIGGRWENQYLDIDDVPSAREPMRLARNLGKEVLGTQSVILFDSLAGSQNPNPPFWFNAASPGERTGVHDHAHLSKLSAVAYLQAEENSGDLFFQMSGFKDLFIKPEVGKMVIFPPNLRHGVHENKTTQERISFAFNLFPFPLMHEEL